MKTTARWLLLLLALAFIPPAPAARSADLTQSTFNVGTLTNNGDTVPIASRGTVGVSITGTFTMTINFEGTIDGTNWSLITTTNPTNNATQTSVTTTGLYVMPCNGMQTCRVRASGASSGSATVQMYSLLGAVNSTGGGGGGGGGGNVSNNGTPVANQYAQWTDATHVQGITTIPFSAITGMVPTAQGSLGIDTSGAGGPGNIAHESSVGVWSVGPFTATDAYGLIQDTSQFSCYDEMDGPFAAGNIFGPCGGWRTFATTGGTVGQVDVSGHPGVFRATGVAAAPSGEVVLGGGTNIFPGTATYEHVYLFRIPTLATAGEDGLFFLGYSDLTTVGAQFTTGNTVAIAADRVTDATHFVCVSTVATVSKVRAASTTTVTAGTWYWGKIVSNAGGSFQLYTAPSTVGPPAWTELSCSQGSAISGANAPTVKMSQFFQAYHSVGTVNLLQLDIDIHAEKYSGLTRP